MIQAKDDAELYQRADEIGAAGDGIVKYLVCMPGDFRDLSDREAAGDFDAHLIVLTWRQLTRSLSTQGRGMRVGCPLCPRSLKPRQFAFVLALPYGVKSPEGGMAFGLCERCAPDRETAEASALEAMVRVFPEMRLLQVSQTAGRA